MTVNDYQRAAELARELRTLLTPITNVDEFVRRVCIVLEELETGVDAWLPQPTQEELPE